jgi:histidinol dehydrogenase
MLLPIIWKKLSQNEQSKLLQRPLQKNEASFTAKVQAIIKQVRTLGDAACADLTKQYDGVDLTSLEVQPDELKAAHKKVPDSARQAMLRVMQQLYAFHSPQKLTAIKVETSTGIFCESQARPIHRVGLYIPGGSAPLVSTVLMLGIPSKIADCPIRILCSPPRQGGSIDPHILVAAKLCGIDKIYKLGGAQAIAAMAYGTETIPKVDKIFGPGNAWVTHAKMLVAQDVAGALYDLPAGPSEVMVIADDDANPEFIAADLLSQAEHGSDSQVILVCTDLALSHKVNAAIQCQIKLLSRRSIAEQALQNSCLILVDTVSEAITIANTYAPEHLIIQVKKPRYYLEEIQSAGSVFLGPWSPEAAGDYASGTNHVLPTHGFARGLSGLSVRDFMKTITIQELTKEGLIDIAETIRVLAAIEGLDAHQRAVDIRIGMEKNAE